MELLIALLIGLLLGLVFTAITWHNARRGKRELVRENEHLKCSLTTFMKIRELGDADLKRRLQVFEERCKNLEIMNASLRERPGRPQLMQLETYERALRIMHERAPGFPGAWQKALQDAEAEIQQIAEGKNPWKRLTISLRGKLKNLVAKHTKVVEFTDVLESTGEFGGYLPKSH